MKQLWTENKSSNKCPRLSKRMTNLKKLHRLKRLKCSLARAPLTSSRNMHRKQLKVSKSKKMESSSRRIKLHLGKKWLLARCLSTRRSPRTMACSRRCKSSNLTTWIRWTSSNSNK